GCAIVVSEAVICAMLEQEPRCLGRRREHQRRRAITSESPVHVGAAQNEHPRHLKLRAARCPDERRPSRQPSCPLAIWISPTAKQLLHFPCGTCLDGAVQGRAQAKAPEPLPCRQCRQEEQNSHTGYGRERCP